MNQSKKETHDKQMNHYSAYNQAEKINQRIQDNHSNQMNHWIKVNHKQ